ncbi:DUF3010 family protein [Pseudoalteromonas sp. SR44-5]|jgi:hypothetical protein|uniref:DUF3010 family protein n=2 Tax=Pseudoalteromonas TaxID=53246 RepID=A0ABY3FIT0_9GAMM|nr:MULTISPECIES: DUF3010 family protein [Pseudoalteromonas]MBB1291788.1 DUF3010 family protein [Pseudoalteromonas sp. SR41-4]MBB1299785.1 DUF3010 family protein [Pseudoalteromonas sp. SR44-8]MBB1308434.1 DUF3010 family protein [Pseudoalteromonas sp. SR41-8]MBB1332388.1 DUF3010 family protein [Pseudoalteromonas sp. SR41-6]MBB1341022.1 DUF3010 family protein [Pseudoalteromonas sp. SR45-6]|tara:strand:+ start:3090 stop:3536 length:447 start_codon:yes stop_codon:yes gene_type:complete
MRTCGVEITGSDVLLCILTKDNDVFDIRDIRQTRFTLGNGNDTEVMRKFQFDFAKLMQDYQIDSVAIRQRAPKGKFAGSANGFKMETAIQLIPELSVYLFSTTEIKEQLKRNPIPIDFAETGLKKYQENAFVNAYVHLMKKTYRSEEL